MVAKLMIFKFTYLPTDQKVAREKSEDVHEAVPSHMQWAETEDNRIDVRKGERHHKGDGEASIFVFEFFSDALAARR